MSDKFEKKVQNKLHELKMEPTRSVWDNVAIELGKSRRRRRIFIWSALPIGLIALFGILYFNFSNIHPQVENPASALEALSVPSEASTIEKEKAPAAAIPYSKREAAGEIPAVGKNNQAASEGKKAQHTQISEEKIAAISPNQKNESVPETNFATIIVKSEIAAESTSLPANRDLNQLQTPIEKSNFPESAFAQPEMIYIIKNEKPRKWTFGVSVQPGISYLSTHTPKVSNPPEYLSSPMFYDPRNSIQGNISAVPEQIDRQTEPGYRIGNSYAVGLSVKRSLGNHWGIVSGLNFRHFSVPQISNTLLRNSSQVIKVNSRNQFNFIELPLLLSYSTEIGKLKINWEGGVTFSKLLSADALQYDYSDRVLYKDDALFRKNQSGLYGGITLGLLSNKNFIIEGGPYYQYSINKVSKEGVFDKKHFNAAGIQLRFSLKK